MDVRLKHPFTCTVAGPTTSGRTKFVLRLIRHSNELIYPPPERILYCYGEFQPSFLELPQVEFHEGLPDVTRFDGWHISFDNRRFDERSDKNLTFNNHISHICKSYLYHLRSLRYIRPCLTLDMAKSVAVAIVQSRLDYCNSLFFGTSQHNIRKL
jgi:hypothetical protein